MSGPATTAPEVTLARTPFTKAGWRYSSMDISALKEIMRARNLTTRDLRDKNDAVARLEKADTQATVYEGMGKQRMQVMVEERAAKWCNCDRRSNGKREKRGQGKRNKARCENPQTTLEIADKHCTFTRFVDVPPELRNRIYEYSFANLSPLAEGLVRPKQPAVTQVSRQLRAESLGLFYATQTFVLKFTGGIVHTKGAEVDPVLSDVDKRWLEGTGEVNVGKIRSLMLTSSTGPPGGSRYHAVGIRICKAPITAHLEYVRYFKHHRSEYGGVEWEEQAKLWIVNTVASELESCNALEPAAIDAEWISKMAMGAALGGKIPYDEAVE